MTPDEAHAVLVRDVARLLHWSIDATEPYVTAIARRHADGVYRTVIHEWLANYLGWQNPAAQLNVIDKVIALLDAPVVT